MLARVVERTAEPSILTDSRGVASLANQAAMRLFQVDPRFFVRRPLINVVARQDTGPFRALLKDLERAPAGAVRVEAVRMRPRGASVFLATVCAARIDASPGAALYWTVRPRPT